FIKDRLGQWPIDVQLLSWIGIGDFVPVWLQDSLGAGEALKPAYLLKEGRVRKAQIVFDEAVEIELPQVLAQDGMAFITEQWRVTVRRMMLVQFRRYAVEQMLAVTGTHHYFDLGTKGFVCWPGI